MSQINAINSTLPKDSAKCKPSRPHKTKEKITYAIFTAAVIATSGLNLGTPAPASAHHRNVGDGECSWFPDRIPLIYDFHQACSNHDACGERAGSNKRAWDHCDKLLYRDALLWCKKSKPTQPKCVKAAQAMYWGLRAFVNGTKIHRD